MKISNKLLLVLASCTLLSGCGTSDEEKQQCPTCSECEECEECPTPHEHTFKETWSMDANKHWKDATCEHKDLTKELGEHIDLDENGICDVCDYAFEVVPNHYVVIWKNYDNELLEVDFDVLEGTMPEYNGEDPVKLSNEDVFIFSGWSPEVTKVTKNTVYVAQYEVDTTTYKVTWEDDIGNILKQEDVQIGHVPSFGDKDPVKESTEMIEYSFAGWDKEPSRVFQDVTYKATFEIEDWCLTQEELINAIKLPENPNFTAEVKTYLEGLKNDLDTGTYQIYGDLIIENVPIYGMVYVTKDGSTIYYDKVLERWTSIQNIYTYNTKLELMFPYSEIDLSHTSIVCDFANKQYIIVEDAGSLVFRTYLKFQNKQLRNMRSECEVIDTHEIGQYFDITYTWGGCEDIEIPEEVLNDIKYKLVDDDPFGVVHNVETSLTVTITDGSPYTNKYYVVRSADGPNLMKVQFGTINGYWDGQYHYTEDVDNSYYTRSISEEDALDVYARYANDFLPDKPYTFNTETLCYEYDNTDIGVTYAAQFEFGYPKFIKVIDDTTKEVNYTITFSNFGTTEIAIPERDWQLV